ncbi:hypothetical protein QJQ45_017180 [Haematococcus lacustris]|nr:hypothetical protein QJQ45_017180 [Haematococcus lacustris]
MIPTCGEVDRAALPSLGFKPGCQCWELYWAGVEPRSVMGEPSGFTRMRGRGESTTTAELLERLGRAAKAPLQQLSKMRFPFKAPSLIDRSAPYFSGIKRFGLPKLIAYYKDPFHTLLNLPWGHFIAVFFATYMTEYVLFAFLYWVQAKDCLVGSNGRFSHVLWISSRVASTLGFDQLHPNPDCSFINFCVMIQARGSLQTLQPLTAAQDGGQAGEGDGEDCTSEDPATCCMLWGELGIAASLVNFIMLGVVFARFSAPFKRAGSVRFSKVAVVNRHSSGFWSISIRVANLRKHQILQPSIRMVVTAVDSITPSFYHHEQLQVDGAYKQVCGCAGCSSSQPALTPAVQLTNLELGFPAHVTHVITPESFLYNLSLLEMDTRMMEVLIFVDGIDAMTSKYMSARMSYSMSDMLVNEQFNPMHLEMRGKHLGLDFNTFDMTSPALDQNLLLEELGRAGQSGEEPALWQLRHYTFRRLAERFAHLGVTHASAVAAAAAGGAAPASTSLGGAAGPILTPIPEEMSGLLAGPYPAPAPSTMPDISSSQGGLMGLGGVPPAAAATAAAGGQQGAGHHAVPMPQGTPSIFAVTSGTPYAVQRAARLVTPGGDPAAAAAAGGAGSSWAQGGGQAGGSPTIAQHPASEIAAGGTWPGRETVVKSESEGGAGLDGLGGTVAGWFGFGGGGGSSAASGSFVPVSSLARGNSAAGGPAGIGVSQGGSQWGQAPAQASTSPSNATSHHQAIRSSGGARNSTPEYASPLLAGVHFSDSSRRDDWEPLGVNGAAPSSAFTLDEQDLEAGHRQGAAPASPPLPTHYHAPAHLAASGQNATLPVSVRAADI